MLNGKRFSKKLQQAIFHAWRANSSDFSAGNHIALLQNGEAYFPALVKAIDRARHEIHFETYIYKNDATGLRIADALKRAALRGVKVYLLIDGYGSQDLPQTMLDDLQQGGVNTLVFGPKISPWTFRRNRLRRMHRKVIVVDREIAFVGGINVIDDTHPADDLPPRYDYAVAVEGPLVEEIRLSAQRLWSLVNWRKFHKGIVHDEPLPASTVVQGRMKAAFLVRDNFHHRRDIEAEYLRAIQQARSEIILANAYFLPGINFRSALINAARRGVRVVLLLQGRVEYVLQHYASRALYGIFIDAGIEIYEYVPSFLHAKVAVIDGTWATVGSSNIDPFSLLLSREANIFVENKEFATTLADSLKKTMAHDGRRIQSENWKQEPLYFRLLSWISYGLLRLLMGISGYVGANS